MGDDVGSDNSGTTPTFSQLFKALATSVRPDGEPWTNEAIAERLGLSQPYVQQLQSGRRGNPSFALVIEIARLFDVPVGYLAGEVDVLPPEDLRLLNAVRTPELRDLIEKLDGIGPQARQVIARLIDEVGSLDREPPRRD